MTDTAHHPPTPPEPKTPNWLPALGAALFFAVGVWWLSTPSTPSAADLAKQAGAANDAGAAAPAAAAPAPH